MMEAPWYLWKSLNVRLNDTCRERLQGVVEWKIQPAKRSGPLPGRITGTSP